VNLCRISGVKWMYGRAERECERTLRSVWNFSDLPPTKDWRFPCKLPKQGPVISKRIVGPRRLRPGELQRGQLPRSAAAAPARVARLSTMRLAFSAAFFCERLGCSSQAPEKWRRCLRTHRIRIVTRLSSAVLDGGWKALTRCVGGARAGSRRPDDGLRSLWLYRGLRAALEHVR
jgi:hypothetical protein